MPSLIIYAPNVGSGGGLVLLLELLQAEWPGLHRIAILDQRARAQLQDPAVRFDVHWSKSSLPGRIHSERLISRLAAPGDIVLCFHNLPPILRSKGRVFVYVQNAYLVGLIPTSHLQGWVKWRYLAERSIARYFRHRVKRYMVQTDSMAAAVSTWFGSGIPPVDVLPFTAGMTTNADSLAAPTERRWDFLFISDGAQHKNHDRLFTAWELLAEQGHFPILAVTLHPQRDIALRARLDAVISRSGARIEDLGTLPHADVLVAYRKAGALIFPSYAESFGIPLLEAKAAGLPVLAPELDYVRDLIDPEMTFDPTSARSIARAVMRFMGCPVERRVILTGQDVADAIINRGTKG